MLKVLTPHCSFEALRKVVVNWEIYPKLITFHFLIHDYRENINPDFELDFHKNWGLWDFDVVEVFIKKEDSTHYLEVQSSPLNQPFALVIEKPRLQYHSPKKLDLQLRNEVQNNVWKSNITIALNDIPGTGKKIMGNCFACLGPQNAREYYAININQDEKPDFHRPELFIPFGEMK